MTTGLPPNLIVHAIHLLCAVFAVHAWLQLRNAARIPGVAIPFAGVVGAAFVLGAAATFHPFLIALRESVFISQPLMIACVIALGVAAGLTTTGRRYFESADLWTILPLYGWRVIFGAALLLLGLSGGLPGGFFWSVALGDVAVGLWALWIMARREAVTRGELLAWNLAGLADLLHALALGGVFLAPFYAANPGVERLGLLPIFGVPLFIALHIHLFRTLRADTRVAAQH